MYTNGHMPLKSFAGVLAAELLQLADKEDEKLRKAQKRVFRDLDTSTSEESYESVSESVEYEEIDNTEEEHSVYSYKTSSGVSIDGCKPVDLTMDGNGN